MKELEKLSYGVSIFFRDRQFVTCYFYIPFFKHHHFCLAKDFQDTDGLQPTDWERYAQEEYDLLVAEEGANEQAEG